MIAIKYTSIPKCFHESAFYKNLAKDDSNEEIFVPENVFKFNKKIETIVDFTDYLCTILFCVQDTISWEITIFCYKNPISVWRNAALEVQEAGCGQITMISALLYVFEEGTDHALVRAIKLQLSDVKAEVRSELIDQLSTIHRLDAGNECQATTAAAGEGNVKNLMSLHSTGYSWDISTFLCAAEGGHINCIEYARSQGLDWNEEVCQSAALNGQLVCLQYLHRHGCPWDHLACQSAASRGQLACLQYLHQHGCPWDQATVHAAASGGHCEVLRYALEHDCPHDSDSGNEDDCETVRLAAAAGSLSCLRYLVEERDVYLGEDGAVFGAAFKGAHFDCVKYLIDHDCPFLCYSFKLPQSSISDETSSTSTSEDDDAQCLACLLYACEHGWDWNQVLADFVLDSREHMPLCFGYVMAQDWVSEEYAKERLLQMCQGKVDKDAVSNDGSSFEVTLASHMGDIDDAIGISTVVMSESILVDCSYVDVASEEKAASIDIARVIDRPSTASKNKSTPLNPSIRRVGILAVLCSAVVVLSMLIRTDFTALYNPFDKGAFMIQEPWFVDAMDYIQEYTVPAAPVTPPKVSYRREVGNFIEVAAPSVSVSAEEVEVAVAVGVDGDTCIGTASPTEAVAEEVALGKHKEEKGGARSEAPETASQTADPSPPANPNPAPNPTPEPEPEPEMDFLLVPYSAAAPPTTARKSKRSARRQRVIKNIKNEHRKAKKKIAAFFDKIF